MSMPPAVHRRVVVVGAGVAGLDCARRLRARGHDVVVVEAADRIGGQIHTIDLAGRRVELGAEALHLAMPIVRDTIADLGLDDDLLRSAPGATWLATPSGLRRLPQGVGPTGPTQLAPVVRSGILSPRGMARAALEPLVARRHRVAGDISVGRFVRARFGDEVADALVDPMLGGLHSGDIDRLSLDSATPSLAAAARAGRSLTLSVRTRRAGPSVAPSQFATIRGGLSVFVDALAEGTHVRTSVRCTDIRPDGAGYVVETTSGPMPADAVVLAMSAPAAGELLADIGGSVVRDALCGVDRASVATFLLAWPKERALACPAVATGTGIMVPRALGLDLKAATFVSTKWPHLAGGDSYLLRLSAGRAGSTILSEHPDDETLVHVLLDDLRRLTGLRGTPLEVVAHRWMQALPQLEVGHGDRVGAARAELARRAPGVHLVGASFDGIGLTSALTSAAAVAARV